MKKEKLLSMSNDQVKETFLHKAVHVKLIDGKEVEFNVANLQLTNFSNDMSYSVIGFISDTERSYLFSVIKEITVIDK